LTHIINLDGAMLVLLYLGYTFLPSVWFMSLTAAFFIPQIIHNAIRGQKYRFDSTYVFLLGAMRVIIPVNLFLLKATHK